MNQNKKYTLLDKIVLIFFFTFGFLIDPMSKSANPSSLRFLVLLIFIFGLCFYFAYRLYKIKQLPILTSKILLMFLGVSFLPILIAIVEWQHWYRNIFTFQSSVVVFFLAALLSFFLANTYNELKKYTLIILFFSFGQVISSFASLLVLILNQYDILDLPNYSYISSEIVNNAGLVSIFILLAAPPLFSKIKKGIRERNLFIALEVGAVIVLGLFLNLGLALTFSTSVILLLLGVKSLRRYAQFYLLSIIVVSALGALAANVITPLEDFRDKVDSTSVAGFEDSASIAFNALKNNNPLLGLSNVLFSDVAQKYAPTNYDNEFDPLYTSAFSSLFEILIKYGIITVIGLAMFILSVSTTLGHVFSKKGQVETAIVEIFVKVSLYFLFSVLLFSQLNLNLLILFAFCVSILSHFESKEYSTNKSLEVNIKFLSLLLVPALVLFIYLSARVAFANYMFAYANELYRTNTVGNQQDALRIFQKTVKVDKRQATYHEELSKIFYGAFAVAQNKLELLNENEKNEVQKYFNNSVMYSNNAISLREEGYYTWVVRFNLMKNLSRFSDTSETVDKASEKLASLAPKNGTLLLSLGSYYVEEDVDKSHEFVLKAYQSNPNVDKAKLEYAKSLEILGRREEAINLLLDLTSDESKVNDEEYQEAALILKNLLKENQSLQNDQNNTSDTNQ